MTILVTGSSGHLGQALVMMLQDSGKSVRGIDKKPNPDTTDIVGSIVDREVCINAVKGCSAVLHTASLHKPHVATHTKQDFIDVNITGTLNLLEASIEENKLGGDIKIFVYTSTTSTFGGALKPNGGDVARSVWIEETTTPIPKNIYGITKCMAEDLCELFWKLHKLPTTVLKVSRFFFEDDDSAEVRDFGHMDNVKMNELLFRRADIYDMCTAHLSATEKGPSLGHQRFIISSDSPFSRDDLEELMIDPGKVVSRYYPDYEAIYGQVGWKMFPKIERVYRNNKARDMLGWKPQYTFQLGLELLRCNKPIGSELARRVGILGYQETVFEEKEGPYPVEG